MANIPFIDSNGDARYLSADGAGTNGDPHIVKQQMVQAAHDNLNGNANIQVGNADVGNANPVPISDAGATVSVDDGSGSLTVDGTVAVTQGTHDNLNGNANMQVGNADVGNANPVPVKDAHLATSTSKYVTSADMSAAAADISDAPTSGQKIVVTDIVISVGTTMVVTIKEETSGTVVMVLDLTAHTAIHIPLHGKLKLATADKKLQAQTSVSGNIYITTTFHSEA